MADRENNQTIVLSFSPEAGRNYPSFLSYDNKTRALTLDPKNSSDVGKTFHFNIVLGETGLDAMSTTFNLDVKVKQKLVPVVKEVVN